MLKQSTRLAARLARAYSTSAPPPLPPGPPPRGSIFTASTVYPFLLLSAITSLALNLSHQRSARQQETAHLSAQISVLETLVNRIASRRAPLSTDEQEDIERELELVGLGRGKGKQAVDAEKSSRPETSWTEALFGKKGKQYEPETDDTDWDTVFREADEAETKRNGKTSASTALPSGADTPTPPTPVLASPPTSSRHPLSSGLEATPPQSKSKPASVVYL
ncbi:hypothetical protein JCM10212_007003 [Sporobolomyces blumeae]